ncbi:hypothetical protein Ga0080559_TMP1785 [Salipiger profundus]|uniref:Uncharacterized protein n=1 Tax=Salipiger profundus TaxID=1229727 RepID=A0A1U7D354_9RHOB|nr:hypothetical protein Ga0080559_TMP1785 [Salipiger profundus]
MCSGSRGPSNAVPPPAISRPAFAIPKTTDAAVRRQAGTPPDGLKIGLS